MRLICIERVKNGRDVLADGSRRTGEVAMTADGDVFVAAADHFHFGLRSKALREAKLATREATFQQLGVVTVRAYLASLEQDMHTAFNLQTDSARGMSSNTAPKG